MSTIKIEDVAHVRFAAPDLEKMAAFLADFGLSPVETRAGVLFAAGAGAAPFVHVTEPGAPRFVAIGLRATSVADLETLARSEGVPVEDLDAPGGGKCVTLTDPDGFRVEVVAGQAAKRAQAESVEQPRNDAAQKRRLRQPVRLKPGPSHVQRLGHCVLSVSDFRRSEAWYKERFGFLTSDEFELAPGMSMGAFLRCDRGALPSDHHTLALMQTPAGPAFMHAAFEVADFDDLMLGHTHLAAAERYQHVRGVGRHILGSQIFDYWNDPWGHELEHWTDGDLFTADDPPHMSTLRELLDVQWGKAITPP